jgi:hypothetical protein
LDTSLTEIALAEKLLRTLHLNVPERAGLYAGKVRFSVLVAAAERLLASGERLPAGWTSDLEYDGAVLELRDGGYWMHECHEIGVMRFSPVRSQLASSINEAVRYYLKRFGDGSTLDGVPIAWDE